MSENTNDKARAVGFNHIALEVRNLDEALKFYGNIFEVKLRSRSKKMAFIDLGDQFLAIAETNEDSKDGERHFGFVVDDQAKALSAAKAAGAEFLQEGGNSFYDPSGNMFQMVQYSEIQFMKTNSVLEFMELGDLKKSDDAKNELRQKGIEVE